ncbi:MAG TPA: acyl-CoA synthetase [Acidimicrobiia bacterium]|nr:acyl-CoA synthetase [Acidimicrobiia bacterium]
MSFNLSELFERVTDSVGDRDAVVTPDARLSYADLDARANRVARHLAAVGIGPGDHVGLMLRNGTEYVEAMLGCFKLRAVPINVNYRYVERELAHLFGDADLVGLVYHRGFAAAVGDVLDAAPGLRRLLVVDDASGVEPVEGSVPYADALAAESPARDFTGRSDDDVYCAYTGGTTGLPKGVLWRHEDIFFAAMGGGDPQLSGRPISDPDELVDRLPAIGLVQLVTPPLIHVAAQWGTFQVLFGGGTAVLSAPGPLDPAEAWGLAARERVHVVTVVGDAMARPLLEHLDALPIEHLPDLSALIVFASGGATLSAHTKATIARLLPTVIVIDGYGSTEIGVTGSETRVGGGGPAGSRFRVDATTAVLDDALRPVAPGSGIVGRLARRGRLPLGYHKDPAKTAATFVDVDGERWALSGDLATVEDDGTIAFLGRGSATINTGGEKVFAEEVESVITAHPDARDAVVVGVPDERWGERVVAVVEPRAGSGLTLAALREHCQPHLAGYKLPKDVVIVDTVVRAPSGKPDYRWARSLAERGVPSGATP